MPLVQKARNFGEFKVLIVEDNARIMALLTMIFDELEIPTVYETSNGEEGLEALNEHPDINLVITDWSMPKMNGMDFIRRARQHVANLPIVLITGQGSTDLAVQASEEGASAFLLKPFTPDKLRTVLEDFLEKDEE